MARIRIVDEWLRSPVSAPARRRAIMVIARSWAEQRVLMRAFAASDDQTRPTITLHGAELAIGPAGTDPHGEWGIHVEPPVDGRAQELREALQLAAKLLAGSKGNPPRLEDEVSEFEGRATNMWAPGTERADEPGKRTVFGHDGAEQAPPEPQYFEPVIGAPQSTSPVIPSSAAAKKSKAMARTNFQSTPPFWGDAYQAPELERGISSRAHAQQAPAPVAAPSPAPRKAVTTSAPAMSAPITPSATGSAAGGFTSQPKKPRKMRQTYRYSGAVATQKPPSEEVLRGPEIKKKAAKTAHGYAAAKTSKEAYAVTAGKTMPLGLTLEEPERMILNALGKQSAMSVSEIGRFLNVEDPMDWMARFMDKLAEFGLDLVTPGDDQDGEPTYILAR